MYVTNSSLAGNVAAAYGFRVDALGTGAATYNVGCNGAAFGVANNSVVTVMYLLRRTNNDTIRGVLWDLNGNGCISTSEQLLRNMANTVFTGINEAGDIC